MHTIVANFAKSCGESGRSWNGGRELLPFFVFFGARPFLTCLWPWLRQRAAVRIKGIINTCQVLEWIGSIVIVVLAFSITRSEPSHFTNKNKMCVGQSEKNMLYSKQRKQIRKNGFKRTRKKIKQNLMQQILYQNPHPDPTK